MQPLPAEPDETGDAVGPSAVPARAGEAAVDTAGAVDAGAPEPATWSALPDAVRERIAELAAAAVAKLPVADVPRQLRPVAKFAPAKRAKLGGAALLAALGDSAQFRTAVIEWLREHRTDVLDPNAAESVSAAAAAVLLGESGAAGRVRLVAKNAEETALRAERDAALARNQRLEAEVAELRLELEQARGAAENVRGEREAEVEKLLRRLREQGVQLRRAKDAAEAARTEADRGGAAQAVELEALNAQLGRERQRVATERARAERASADAEIARQSAREAREADEVRLALLIDTIDGAVSGLRRELALGDRGARPADMVRGVTSGLGPGGRIQDVPALDRHLALPNVHLIVDGYNVTKTGYPELALADQRDRLIHQLSALAARTAAEVTVVFDGAGVLSVPAAVPRGVRVLFSDRGVLADDVIRALVAAEPKGRPMVVATSDRAVADSVRAAGAHPAPSAVLVSRLGRV
ncbi:NYN domain-containing protein [Amycolatopsis saalfeldensis]|uniref:YacP-like NYN domain-containing protein n=1 Tax=Amycolatopsis saalfeldensis TaxID=394193 RepID=A0A1H8WWL4_9PSEU|nr:NYN domain-containing protein [Amycolatopsis saalfeldensis]SEP32036.1 YacP-like NYN domain-containing protein [Amycolatopsis saalfeldensis]